jgi:hypothetical protein
LPLFFSCLRFGFSGSQHSDCFLAGFVVVGSSFEAGEKAVLGYPPPGPGVEGGGAYTVEVLWLAGGRVCEVSTFLPWLVIGVFRFVVNRLCP